MEETKNQIDHNIINGLWRHSLENEVVHIEANKGSDQYLLLAKIKKNLRKAPSKAEPTQH